MSADRPLDDGTLVTFIGSTGKVREGYIVGHLADTYLVETKHETRQVPMADVTVAKPAENPTVAEMLKDGETVLFFGITGKTRVGIVVGRLGTDYLVRTKHEIRPVAPYAVVAPFAGSVA